MKYEYDFGFGSLCSLPYIIQNVKMRRGAESVIKDVLDHHTYGNYFDINGQRVRNGEIQEKSVFFSYFQMPENYVRIEMSRHYVGRERRDANG